MQDRANVETLLSDIRAARIAGDLETLAAMFAEDATFRIEGAGPPVSGKQAIREALRGLVDEFQFLEWRPIKTLVDGDEVSIRSRLKIRHSGSGKIVDTETSDFLTFKGDKCSSWVEYVDTALVGDLRQP